MQGTLSSEYASTVDLPLNPFSRHRVVAAMLADPRFVGDTTVLVNKKSFSTEGHATTIAISTVLPLLGRSALQRVAQSIEYVENNYSGTNQGDIDGEDF